MRRQAQQYPINVVGGTKETGMREVLEEDLSTEREMELESVVSSTLRNGSKKRAYTPYRLENDMIDREYLWNPALN